MNPDPLHPERPTCAWVAAATAALLAVAAAPAQAAAVYAEHWHGGDSTEGWVSNSGQADLFPSATEGLPPGSITSVFMAPDGSPQKVVGAASGALPLRGSFYGHRWQVSFDALRVHGMATELSLRYRLYDTPGGWRLPLPLPDMGDWTHYEVLFDPAWTDDEAMAAGWIAEPYAWDWQTAMGHVTATELRLALSDDVTTAAVHFDNFVQQHEGTVPVPATAWLVVLSLGLLAMRRMSVSPRAATGQP